MLDGLGVVGVLAGLACSATVAHAQSPQRFALNWVREDGAESCITSNELASVVQNAFGPVFVLPDQADLAIEGNVWRDAERWRARIAISDRSGALTGVRELETSEPSCRALTAQIVLVIAIAIDPEVALDGLPTELLEQLGAPSDTAGALLSELRSEQAAAKAVVPDAPVVTEQRAAPPARASRAMEPEQGLSFGAYALAGLTGELQPAIDPALGLGFEVGLGALFSVQASALWAVPSDVAIESAGVAPASVRLDLWLFSLAPCVTPLRFKKLRGTMCAGASLLARSAEAEGLIRADDPSEVDPAAMAGALITYRALTPLALQLGLALHVPFEQARFSYRLSETQTVELFTPGLVGIVTFLGVGIEL